MGNGREKGRGVRGAGVVVCLGGGRRGRRENRCRHRPRSTTMPFERALHVTVVHAPDVDEIQQNILPTTHTGMGAAASQAQNAMSSAAHHRCDTVTWLYKAGMLHSSAEVIQEQVTGYEVYEDLDLRVQLGEGGYDGRCIGRDLSFGRCRRRRVAESLTLAAESPRRPRRMPANSLLECTEGEAEVRRTMKDGQQEDGPRICPSHLVNLGVSFQEDKCRPRECVTRCAPLQGRLSPTLR